MNLPQPDNQPISQEDLAAQQRRMRVLLQATSIAVLILTGTMFVFLYRQVVLVRRQTAELVRYVDEVNRSGMQTFMEQVRDRFNTFRKDHPDFNPIYLRYFNTNEPPARERVTDLPTTNSQAPAP
jgi:hypothetical protein